MDMAIAEQLLLARNGKEVLELLIRRQQWLPELILLNINMPVMDGFAYCFLV